MPAFESDVVDVTVAVFVTVPLAFDGTEYVERIVTVAPAVSVPRLQG